MSDREYRKRLEKLMKSRRQLIDEALREIDNAPQKMMRMLVLIVLGLAMGGVILAFTLAPSTPPKRIPEVREIPTGF